ncbi:phospholipid phosphatase 1 [Cyclospora cayetanensis]|uniref:Phospholipid phosphatase 1 n=1 Tax=Cyclospora cayetanensis TaxID=88456 RepID=A0A6P6RR70_9EIME|nr:phospholipid phosphatase 1 [Cyclospora cayetanensis]
MELCKFGASTDGSKDIENGEVGVPPSSSSVSVGGVAPNYPLRILTHIVTLGIICSLAALVLNSPVTIRGTFCNNTDSALPMKKRSITRVMLLSIGFFTPSLIIILVECLIAAVRVTQEKQGNGSPVTLFGWTVPQLLVDLYIHLGGFGFCHACAWLLVDSIKGYVGSLRPNFFDVCKPDWSKVNCKNSRGEYIYVTDFHCTGGPGGVEEARRSFPSAHAAYAMCGMLFAILYLQYRLRWQQQETAPKRHLRNRQGILGLLEQLYWIVQACVPILQVLMFLLALYVPATRVLEHYHHVRDVCGGAAVGAVCALFGAFFVIDMRNR